MRLQVPPTNGTVKRRDLYILPPQPARQTTAPI